MHRLAAVVAIVALALSILFRIAASDADARTAASTTHDGGAATRIVPLARGGAAAVPLSDAVPAARRTATYAASSEALRPRELTTVNVTLRNIGDAVWNANGDRAVRLSYHLYDPSGALQTWDGLRTELPHDMEPGSFETIAMRFAAPPVTGAYTVSPDLIRDGV